MWLIYEIGQLLLLLLRQLWVELGRMLLLLLLLLLLVVLVLLVLLLLLVSQSGHYEIGCHIALLAFGLRCFVCSVLTELNIKCVCNVVW